MVDDDAVREQIQRILADPLFHRSKRSSDLLKFIVERTIHLQDISERIIGIEVFERAPDFDTSLDSIVRVAATEIRKRLALYYDKPGHEGELRVEVPHGSYLAQFRMPPPHPQTGSSAGERTEKRSWGFWLAAAPVAVLILGFITWQVLHTSSGTVIDQFWGPILSRSGHVLLSVSSPKGGGLSPAESVTSIKAPSPDSSLSDFLLERQNQVPAAAYALRSFLAQRTRDSIVRPARETELSELRSSPVVLIGSFANEWTMRFGDELPYRFRRESERGLRWIEDASNPARRDWAVNMSASYGKITTDYAVVSRYLDRSTGQWLLAFGGLTSFGTDAACELSVTPNAMAALASRLPEGWDSRNLQLVVAVKLIQGSPGSAEVVAVRSW